MMPGERRYTPRSTGPSWVATLGGALLLVAVGFGVGLVAGTAYEEPQLVAEHLSGQTTEIPLAAEGENGSDALAEPDVAAAAPLDPAAEGEPAPLGAGALDAEREERVAAAAPLAPPQAAVSLDPAAAPGWSIQVGAFGNEGTARELAGELGRRGYSAYIVDLGEDARFKVRVGPIATREEAERVAARLKSEQRLPTWILAGGRR
jgi:DedD protein